MNLVAQPSWLRVLRASLPALAAGGRMPPEPAGSEACATRFMGSLHGLSTAHWDHEPLPSRQLAIGNRQSAIGRFMGSVLVPHIISTSWERLAVGGWWTKPESPAGRVWCEAERCIRPEGRPAGPTTDHEYGWRSLPAAPFARGCAGSG